MVAVAGDPVMHRAVVIALALIAPELAAQRTWLDPTPDNAVGLVLGSAVFRDGVTAFPTATVAFRARVALASDLVLTAELPRGHARQKSGLSGTAIGLPWLGIELKATPWMTIEFGGRTSLDSPASQREILPYAYGPSLDFDRPEAWAAGASAVRAVAQVGSPPGQGRFLSGRLGVTGTNASTFNGDGRLHIEYGGRVGLARSGWMGWFGLLGRGRVIESGGGFGERTVHQLEAALATRGSRDRMVLSLRRFVAEPFATTMPLIVRLEFMAALDR